MTGWVVVMLLALLLSLHWNGPRVTLLLAVSGLLFGAVLAAMGTSSTQS